MLTKEEYKSECIRMWDSLRKSDKGRSDCAGVNCTNCPLNRFCHKPKIYDAFELIEIVEQWSKKHPIITMEDKYKEVFGVDPKDRSDRSLCPHLLGFRNFNIDCNGFCEDCKNQFWNSEYKEPEKDGEK